MQRKDIPQVALLHLKVAQHVKDVSDDPYFDFKTSETSQLEEIVTYNLNDPDSRIFVARVDGNAVAFISGHVIPCYLPISRVKKVGYISVAYSCPEYRGKGVMKKLEELITEFFRNKGAEFVELHVMFGNKEAMNVWEKLGYQTFRVHMRRKI